MKRFKLTSEYIEKHGRKAFRIEATRDFDLPFPFGKVKKGDKGGFIEKEEYLKQDREGWVFDGGEIWGGEIWDGVIRGGEIWDGRIYGGVISGGVIRGGVIRGGQIWGGEIWDGRIWGGEIWDGRIWGGEIRGGKIWGGIIRGGRIWGGLIYGGEINGGVIRGGKISGGIIMGGEIWDGRIYGGEINGGVIRGGQDILVLLNIGSKNGVLTVTRKSDNTLFVNRGCFTGSLDEFKKEVKKTHGEKKQGKAYKLIIDYIEYHFYELHEK